MAGNAAYRIVIIGGGMVGVSFALAMRAADPDCRARVTLLEAFPMAAGAGDEPPVYTPSFDARSTALSWGSRRIYDHLGAWARLSQHATPIRRIHVSEAGRFGVTRIDAAQEGVEALGYVMENHWLGRVLLHQLLGQQEIELLAPARVVGLDASGAGHRVHYQCCGEGQATGRETLEADLVIVADGGKSGLREMLGIHERRQEYGQNAVVFNASTAKPHGGTAYERFTADGPLAFLPLDDGRSGVIWSLPADKAARVAALPDADFIGELQEVFGYRLGPLTRVGERFCYPLVLALVDEQVRPGLVVLGNAAHTLHPVAGQGYNLALRDAAALATEAGAALREGVSPGALQVLNRYQEQRGADQGRVVGFTDGLNRLFTSPRRDLSLLRNGAMLGIDLLPGAKHVLARHAMGLG